MQGLSVEFKLDRGLPNRFMARELVSSFWVYGSTVGRVSAPGVGRVPPESVRRVSSNYLKFLNKKSKVATYLIVNVRDLRS